MLQPNVTNEQLFAICSELETQGDPASRFNGMCITDDQMARAQAEEDPESPIAFPFQTVAVESAVRGGVGGGFGIRVAAAAWDSSSAHSPSPTLHHFTSLYPPLSPTLQADLLAMRRSLGSVVQYFEKDAIAVVDNIPSSTIELPADMATIDASVPWGCARLRRGGVVMQYRV